MSTSICKYKGTTISFDISGEGLASSPEYLEAIEAIQECDGITDMIVEQFSEIDQSIRKFKETIYDASDSMTSFSDEIFNNLSKFKPKNEAESEFAGIAALVGLGVGAAGYAAKGVGWIVSNVRQKRAERKRDRMIEESIAKKQEIISTKYEPIKRLRNKFSSSTLPFFERLYGKEFQSTVNVKDPVLNKRTGMFKQTLGLLIKSRFLLNTLDYAIAEMDAWKIGEDDSSFKTKSFNRILEDEISSWPNQLGKQKMDWDSFVCQWLNKDSEEYPTPVAMMFTDPVFFSRYIGVNIERINNCPTALLETYLDGSSPNDYPAERLFGQNPYYLDCIQNVRDNWVQLEKPAGFGILDFLIILAPMAASFMVSFFVFAYFPGTFIRVLAILLSLAIIVLFPLMYFGNIVDLPDLTPPFLRRYEEYQNQIKEMLENIEKRERRYRKNNNVITV
jgi:hypothetical protein